MEEALALASIFFFFGVIILVMIWFYKTWFRDRIRIKVCVDDGMRIRCASANIVDRKYVKDEAGKEQEYLVLKTKFFSHEVQVPKNSFRITRSRIFGDYITYLVSPDGTPLVWSKDNIDTRLDVKSFWTMKKYNLAAQTLGYIRWLPIIKLFVILIIIMIVIFGILLGYMASQIHPTVVVNIPHVNNTVANTTTTTTTVTPPPPPG